VQNWRNASIKALAIEDNWRDMNVVDFDLEAHLSRFSDLEAYGVDDRINGCPPATREGRNRGLAQVGIRRIRLQAQERRRNQAKKVEVRNHQRGPCSAGSQPGGYVPITPRSSSIQARPYQHCAFV
jgi:hypothetical protein